MTAASAGGAVAEALQYRDGRPEDGPVLALQNPPPRLLKFVARALGPARAVRAEQEPEHGNVAEPLLKEARVCKDEGPDPAHAFGAPGVFRYEVERIRDRLLEVLLFEWGPDVRQNRGDLLGLELARTAESKGRGDAGIDAVAVDPLEIECLLSRPGTPRSTGSGRQRPR